MREGVKNGDERMVKNEYGRSGTNWDEEVVQIGMKKWYKWGMGMKEGVQNWLF